jgi:DNA helicase-2/ATP-dependent DNA helicase PcrA
MQTFINSNVELFDYAKSFNYSEFLKIYVSKDQLLDDKKQDEDDEK